MSEVKFDLAKEKDQTILTLKSDGEMLFFVPKSDYDQLKAVIEAERRKGMDVASDNESLQLLIAEKDKEIERLKRWGDHWHQLCADHLPREIWVENRFKEFK